MTRITNFGRKRTHVEAGFAPEPAAELEQSNPPAPTAAALTEASTVDAPPAKKKRKRTPKSKRDNYGKDKPADAGATPAEGDAAAEGKDASTKQAPSGELSKRKLKKKEKAKQWREKSTSCSSHLHTLSSR
jgi:zinc finger CCHC domain-containing protein 9